MGPVAGRIILGILLALLFLLVVVLLIPARVRFSYDRERMEAALAETRAMEGIHCVRAWLNEGELAPGDDIMYVLVGGDIRPRVVEALQFLVEKLKSECVSEEELFT